MGEEVGLGADFHGSAEIHHDDVVGHVLDHRQVVADEEIGKAEPFLKIDQKVQDLALDREVEGGDGFIQHQHLRFQHQRASNGNALALAAREHMRVAVEMLRPKAHQLQHVAGLGLAVGGFHRRAG